MLLHLLQRLHVKIGYRQLHTTHRAISLRRPAHKMRSQSGATQGIVSVVLQMQRSVLRTLYPRCLTDEL